MVQSWHVKTFVDLSFLAVANPHICKNTELISSIFFICIKHDLNQSKTQRNASSVIIYRPSINKKN